MPDRKQNRTDNGTDRLQEIHARLEDCRSRKVLSTQYPADIAWLLERESQMMGALRMTAVLALHCCDNPIGRESLNDCLRDFGFTLEEVEARDA